MVLIPAAIAGYMYYKKQKADREAREAAEGEDLHDGEAAGQADPLSSSHKIAEQVASNNEEVDPTNKPLGPVGKFRLFCENLEKEVRKAQEQKLTGAAEEALGKSDAPGAANEVALNHDAVDDRLGTPSENEHSVVAEPRASKKSLDAKYQSSSGNETRHESSLDPESSSPNFYVDRKNVNSEEKEGEQPTARSSEDDAKSTPANVQPSVFTSLPSISAVYLDLEFTTRGADNALFQSGMTTFTETSNQGLTKQTKTLDCSDLTHFPSSTSLEMIPNRRRIATM